ncbi:protein TIC 62, chloroplastic isoform X4 [Dendrobium catenatum]|uniref:protein TIC 62, chloroplastic isoform X4 n=1 Tax=Dendrobium catenatum TaxID=906689 RepID=UPI0010A096AB|nr:protein TIC 62, chloroplastic isoform X4 [Dendrobium catenatum]
MELFFLLSPAPAFLLSSSTSTKSRTKSPSFFTGSSTYRRNRMDVFCMLSPYSVAHLPSSSALKSTRMESPIFDSGGHSVRVPESKIFPFYSRNASSFDSSLPVFRGAPAATLKSLKVQATSNQEVDIIDKDTVFVAGATGRVGSRTVRELLKLGFRVRAGVRSSQRAEALVQGVQQMKLDGKDGNPDVQPIRNLEIVTCDLENQASIIPAIGNASVIICSIGASEKEVFDVTGPYRIDYKATKNLIKAATLANVDHFILVTSLGTNKIGFPASFLNLFWGVLLWKRKAEVALIASGLSYTIVRPGGMERPTDSFKETHNLVLAKEDTYFGGLVSNLQEIPGQFEVDSRPGVQSDSTGIAEETFSTKTAPKTRPLSPYFMYDDFKPPTSPTPSKAIASSKVTRSVETEPKLESSAEITLPLPANEITEGAAQTSPNHWPQSPYTAYEDLKPPTTPFPTPSSAKENPKDGPVK